MAEAGAPDWAPHERPMMPGSAPTPDHAPWLRAAYGLVGVLVGITGGLGNAVITVNLPILQGALGLGPVQGAWLPTVFVMTSVCASLLLFKIRQQFGLRLFAETGLGVYVLLMAGDLLMRDFNSALILRAASGFIGSCLTTLGIFYLLQALPPRHRLKALVFGLGLSSLAIPLARLFSAELVQISEARGLHVFELGMSLVSFGAVLLLKLPPSEKLKAFEPLDFLTLSLFVPGMALLCAVLGLGRVVWWTEAAWVGYALCGSLVLLSIAFIIEHHRANPLFHTRWMTSGDMLRLAFVSMLVRVILSEQTYGAVGLLQAVGVGTDQLRGLFAVILVATAAGMVVSALTLNPERLGPPIMAALALMAIGAFMDSNASNLTRPGQMYVSQALLAFAASLFMGPALMFGVARALQQGPALMISFIAIFSGSQTLGGLAGSALVGTLQIWREKFHSNQLAQAVNPADPVVAGRLQALSGVYGHIQTDPVLRNAEGAALLGQQATREANVLAFNDIFLVLGVVASLTCLWIAMLYVRARLRTRHEALAVQRAHPAAGSL